MQEISPEKNMREKNSCRLSPPPLKTNQFSDDFFLKLKLYDQEGKLR